jgi:hypothetical protein
MSAVPFKANAAGGHRIPRQRHRVTNWPEYDAALRQRGSLTVWFIEEAIAAWRAEPRTTRGGQPHYSALAIATGLALRSVFLWALRQTEGLIGSIIHLLGLDLAIPDHLLVAGFSDRSNSPVRRRNGGFPCWIWAPTVRRDKINRWNCLERNFIGVRVGCSQSAMSVLTQNVFGTIQAITEKIGHFSASRPNSRGQRNPQPVD